MNLDLRLLRKTNIQFNEVGSELQKTVKLENFYSVMRSFR